MLTRRPAITRISSAFARSVGGVLLSAGFAKLPGTGASTLFQAHALPDSLVTAAAQVEIIVGLWLITGWRRRSASIVAGCLFVVLAVFAARQLYLGESQCECFGAVSLRAPSWLWSSYHAFVFDVVAAMIFLLASRSAHLTPDASTCHDAVPARSSSPVQ